MLYEKPPGDGMLKRISISNFKSISEIEVTLGDVTVLVGPNNSGKSSVLQALQFAVSVSQSLSLNGVFKLAGDGRSGTLSQDQLIYTPLKDVYALGTGGNLTQNEESAIVIRLHTDDDDAEIRVRRGRNKNIAVSVIAKSLWAALSSIQNLYSIIAPGLAGIPAHEDFKTPGVIRRAAAKGDANNILRNVLLLLKDNPSEWESFHSRIRRIFPDLELRINFNPEADEFITAEASWGEGWLPIDSCGTGVLQAIQILSYVGAYKPRILILDEPDSHLHPNNQRILAQLLSEIARQESFQVIISTHSRHLLDEFQQMGATLHCIAGNGISTDDFDMVKTLLDLGALDAIDKLRNGTVSLLVLTEDAKTEIIDALVESSGWDRSEFITFSYEGCGNAKSARLLVKFILDTAPNTSVLIHRDRDAMDTSEVTEWCASMRAANAIPFVTEGTDTESHFLNADHLCELYAPLSPERARELIEEAATAVREESISKLANGRVQVAMARKKADQSISANVHTIVRETEKDFDNDPLRHCHGKKALGRLRQLLQSESMPNKNILVASSHLSIPGIAEIKKDRDPTPR